MASRDLRQSVETWSQLLRDWLQEVDDQATEEIRLNLAPVLSPGALTILDDDLLLLRGQEYKAEAAAIARAFIGRCLTGGEALWDIEYLMPEAPMQVGKVDPVKLCKRLLAPKVLRRDVDVCRYCGHPTDDHWGDNCGVCMHGQGGINGVTPEQHISCNCVSMGLPDDWILKAHKEGAHAPV